MEAQKMFAIARDSKYELAAESEEMAWAEFHDDAHWRVERTMSLDEFIVEMKMQGFACIPVTVSPCVE